MRIFVANEAGDMLIKAMQITAQKAQPEHPGPETATMANPRLALNFAANWRGAGQRSLDYSLGAHGGASRWGACDGYLVT